MRIGIPSGWDEDHIVIFDINGTQVTDLQYGSYVQFNVTNGHGYRILSDEMVCGFTYDKDWLSVDFTDTSTSDYPITSWSWDFGDGQISDDQDPSHNYTNPGNYTVILTVEDENGIIGQYSENITVELKTIENNIGSLIPLIISMTSLVVMMILIGNVIIRPFERMFKKFT
jgi:PKD repeat protein